MRMPAAGPPPPSVRSPATTSMRPHGDTCMHVTISPISNVASSSPCTQYHVANLTILQIGITIMKLEGQFEFSTFTIFIEWLEALSALNAHNSMHEVNA